jgi:small subunit ribosomal protein S20
MANHSSSKKAIRQIAKRTAVNKSRISKIRTFFKKAIEAITGSAQKSDAESAFKKAQSEIARGVKKGVLKKNTAARQVSRLASKLKTKE